MKIVWKWTLFVAIIILFGNCNNAPSEEALRLAEEGATARLINEPDPEKVRMENFLKQYETLDRKSVV